jgi:tetratricopeptide (TPR) repeat protein
VRIRPLTKAQTSRILQEAAEKEGLSIIGTLNLSASPQAVVFAVQSISSQAKQVNAEDLVPKILQAAEAIRKHLNQLLKDTSIRALLLTLRLIGWVQKTGTIERRLARSIFAHLGRPAADFGPSLARINAIADIGRTTVTVPDHYLELFPWSLKEELDTLITLKQPLAAWAKHTRSTRLLYWLTQLLEEQLQWSVALELIRQVLALDRRFDNKLRIVADLNEQGILLRLIGKLEESKASHLEALRLVDALDDLLGQAATLNNLGNPLSQSYQLEEALEKYLGYEVQMM